MKPAPIPWIGWGVRGVWSYVGVAIGMAVVRLRTTWLLLIALGAAALVTGVISDGWTESVLFLPAIIVSISAMMAAFGRNIAAMNALRATRDQMAQMAVERERSRVARDLHDILGHSLTVITVKSELAGRLVDVDPAQARIELDRVERHGIAAQPHHVAQVQIAVALADQTFPAAPLEEGREAQVLGLAPGFQRLDGLGARREEGEAGGDRRPDRGGRTELAVLRRARSRRASPRPGRRARGRRRRV